jgi:hypothetical protein
MIWAEMSSYEIDYNADFGVVDDAASNERNQWS